LKRAYANRGIGHKTKPSGRRAKSNAAEGNVEVELGRAEVLGLMQDSRRTLATHRAKKLEETRIAYHLKPFAGTLRVAKPVR
jgi:hypothetical protein